MRGRWALCERAGGGEAEAERGGPDAGGAGSAVVEYGRKRDFGGAAGARGGEWAETVVDRACVKSENAERQCKACTKTGATKAAQHVQDICKRFAKNIQIGDSAYPIELS